MKFFVYAALGVVAGQYHMGYQDECVYCDTYDDGAGCYACTDYCTEEGYQWWECDAAAGDWGEADAASGDWGDDAADWDDPCECCDEWECWYCCEGEAEAEAVDLGMGCESDYDCGEWEVCAVTEIWGVDTEHPDFSEEAHDMIESMFPITMCLDEESCWDMMDDMNMDDSPYEFMLWCGDDHRWGGAATKAFTLLSAAVLAYASI